MKKLIYGLGAVALTTTPIIAVVSCGHKNVTVTTKGDIDTSVDNAQSYSNSQDASTHYNANASVIYKEDGNTLSIDFTEYNGHSMDAAVLASLTMEWHTALQSFGNAHKGQRIHLSFKSDRDTYMTMRLRDVDLNVPKNGWNSYEEAGSAFSSALDAEKLLIEDLQLKAAETRIKDIFSKLPAYKGVLTKPGTPAPTRDVSQFFANMTPSRIGNVNTSLITRINLPALTAGQKSIETISFQIKLGNLVRVIPLTVNFDQDNGSDEAIKFSLSPVLSPKQAPVAVVLIPLHSVEDQRHIGVTTTPDGKGIMVNLTPFEGTELYGSLVMKIQREVGDAVAKFANEHKGETIKFYVWGSPIALSSTGFEAATLNVPATGYASGDYALSAIRSSIHSAWMEADMNAVRGTEKIVQTVIAQLGPFNVISGNQTSITDGIINYINKIPAINGVKVELDKAQLAGSGIVTLARPGSQLVLLTFSRGTFKEQVNVRLDFVATGGKPIQGVLAR